MLSLYVHIPFCEKKCFYCSFVVSVGQEKKINQYLKALGKESFLYKGSQVASVYIGGGTPSLLDADQILRLFESLRSVINICSGAEITFEANPESLSDAKLKVLYQCGVTRLSLGVQTLDDKLLCRLGRNHDGATARDTWERAKASGFNNINMDLIFGLPGQCWDDIRQDIDGLVRLNPQHLSLYALDIEPNSRFYAEHHSVSSDAQARFYESICAVLGSHGYHQYEISNFAQKGFESRHNLHYWNCGEYIGLGIGAHSFLSGRRFWNISRLTDYLNKVDSDENVVLGEEFLTQDQMAKERLLFGLRMNVGVYIPKLRKEFPNVFDDHYLSELMQFVESGHLLFEQGYLRTTILGRLVLDEISARLI